MLHILLLAACAEPFPCAGDELLDANGDCVAATEDGGSAQPDGGSDGGVGDGGDGGDGGGEDGGGDDPVDQDGDGSTLEQGDCDDADPLRFPGADERCNGLDDDCDGLVSSQELTDADADGELACLDCVDLDATLQDGDGSCAAQTFPLGFMSVEDSADFATLADHGITRVHAYNFGPWPGNPLSADLAWSLAYLDEAEAAGLSVLANLHGRTRAERGADLAEFEEFVDGVASHGALAGWYLADEPEYSIQPADLDDMSAALQARTPDLPIQIAHCWCSGTTASAWWSFWDQGDTVMPDFYGITNQEAPSIYAFYHPLFSSYLNTYYSEDAVQPIQQAFNYAIYSAEDPVSYPADSRFPTREELRFWAYSDLSLGVTGLWWWSWARANEHEDGAAWLADTFWPVLDEVGAFIAAAHPASAPVQVNPGPNDLIDYTYLATWPRPGASLVVATNGSNDTRTLDIVLGAAFADQTLSGWDDETLDLSLDTTGSATVEAAPYAVFLWVLAPTLRPG